MTNFANKNTRAGSDDEFILAVTHYLRDIWEISPELMAKNAPVFFDGEGCYSTESIYTQHQYPDITIYANSGRRTISLLVELDGKPPEFGGSKSKKIASYHDTPSGQRHDVKRNGRYTDANLYYIRFSASESNLMGWKWQKIIDVGMRAWQCGRLGHMKSQHAGDQCPRCGQ